MRSHSLARSASRPSPVQSGSKERESKRVGRDGSGRTGHPGSGVGTTREQIWEAPDASLQISRPPQAGDSEEEMDSGKQLGAGPSHWQEVQASKSADPGYHGGEEHEGASLAVLSAEVEARSDWLVPEMDNQSVQHRAGGAGTRRRPVTSSSSDTRGGGRGRRSFGRRCVRRQQGQGSLQDPGPIRRRVV
jgi:hypothetical protein